MVKRNKTFSIKQINIEEKEHMRKVKKKLKQNLPISSKIRIYKRYGTLEDWMIQDFFVRQISFMLDIQFTTDACCD